MLPKSITRSPTDFLMAFVLLFFLVHTPMPVLCFLFKLTPLAIFFGQSKIVLSLKRQSHCSWGFNGASMTASLTASMMCH